MGKHIEMFRRTQKFDAILGGAEEVLFDLGVRQAYVALLSGPMRRITC
jgi:hypothetical protein